jgi:hypothetical protein
MYLHRPNNGAELPYEISGEIFLLVCAMPSQDAFEHAPLGHYHGMYHHAALRSGPLPDS